jgi:hypothetical protein
MNFEIFIIKKMSKDIRKMIDKVKSYEQILNEGVGRVLTLYHGTCGDNGKNLIENGWEPIITGYGGNMGNPNYLYLSSEPEDALWFAEEKGCDTVIEVVNVPIKYLRPDPEDEAGFTMKELLDRINTSGFPAKFVLTKPLDNTHFKIKKKGGFF